MLLTLPAAEMRNLPAIADTLAEVPMMRRGKLAELLLAKDYIPQLVSLAESRGLRLAEPALDDAGRPCAPPADGGWVFRFER